MMRKGRRSGIRRMAEERADGVKKRGYHLAYLACAYLKTDVPYTWPCTPLCAVPGARIHSNTGRYDVLRNCTTQSYRCALRKTFSECPERETPESGLDTCRAFCFFSTVNITDCPVGFSCKVAAWSIHAACSTHYFRRVDN